MGKKKKLSIDKLLERVRKGEKIRIVIDNDCWFAYDKELTEDGENCGGSFDDHPKDLLLWALEELGFEPEEV